MTISARFEQSRIRISAVQQHSNCNRGSQHEPFHCLYLNTSDERENHKRAESALPCSILRRPQSHDLIDTSFWGPAVGLFEALIWNSWSDRYRRQCQISKFDGSVRIRQFCRWPDNQAYRAILNNVKTTMEPDSRRHISVTATSDARIPN